MKKVLILLAILFAVTHGAHAITVGPPVQPGDIDATYTSCIVRGCTAAITTWRIIGESQDRCNDTVVSTCYSCDGNYVKVQSCRYSCKNGKTPVKNTKQITSTTSIEYYTCPLATCTDCDSTDWMTLAPPNTRYQSKTAATCNDGTCNKITSYRCSAGYYGIEKSGSMPACTSCSPGTSDLGDNSFQTRCYIKAGALQSDTVGNYVFTEKCYYTN